MSKINKVGILYHANCIDGFTSYWVAARSLDMSYPVLSKAVSYSTPMKEIEAFAAQVDMIYFLDFSLSPQNLQLLSQTCKHIIVLDHHKTFIESLTDAGNIVDRWSELNAGVGYCSIDQHIHIYYSYEHSGASLASWYFHNYDLESCSNLVKYVTDHDLWTHNNPDTAAINKWLTLQEKILTVWDTCEISMKDSRIYSTLTIARKLQEYHMLLARNVCKAAQEITLLDAVGIGVACPYDLRNEVCQELLDTHPHSFAATWVQEGEDIVFSLRSRKNSFDVASLAQHFGGGGHAEAAAFRCNYRAFKYLGELAAKSFYVLKS